MAVVRSASITTSQVSISLAAAVPTETMRPCSQTMLSPCANGAFQSPETMVPILVIATRMDQSSTCSGRRTEWPVATARSIAMVVSRLMRACSGVVWMVGAPVTR